MDSFISLLMPVLLMALFLGVSADVVHVSGNYEKGHCMSLILIDGFVTKCFDENVNLFSIQGETFGRYEYYLILYYDQITMRLKGLKFVNNGHKLQANSTTLIENKLSKMQLISPVPYSIITSDFIDFYYNIYSNEDNLFLRLVDLTAYTDEYESHQRVDKSDAFFNITVTKETLHHYSVDISYAPPTAARITNMCAYFYNSYVFNAPDYITFVCFGVDIPTHKYRYPQLLQNVEVDDQMLASAVHILLYSTNSMERYDEAVVMVKSLLYHRDSDTLLIIHIVTDSNGAVYFEKLFQKYLKKNSVVFIIHDVNEVCKVPLAKFFRETDTYMSHHHSGHVGYCRLFIYDYFLQYRFDPSSPMYKYTPQRVITIETDQLFVSSVDELWNYADRYEGNKKILLAAAENYQPFLDSRLDRKFRNFASADKVHSNEGDEYHGFGLIGGIMILYLDHQHEVNWTNYLPESFKKYQKNYYDTYNSSFNPQLNDQDIFNSIVDADPTIFHPLPCNYNVQLHAKLNTYLQCYHHIFDDCQVTNADGTVSKCDYTDDNTVSLFLDMKEVYTYDAPSNCERSRHKNMFLCEKRPAKVIHFMAKSYAKDSGLNFYKGFWNHYKSLPWSLI